MECKRCGKELTDENMADSTGWKGYCYDCEEEILEEENNPED